MRRIVLHFNTPIREMGLTAKEKSGYKHRHWEDWEEGGVRAFKLGILFVLPVDL